MHPRQKTRLYEFDSNQLLRLRKIAVVGDLHGDFDSLSSLLQSVDPNRDGIIFLGDYADRGPQGVEVIERIHSLMNEHPLNVTALKGNHEDYTDTGGPTFAPCDLIHEARAKRGSWQTYFQEKLKPFTSRLYLAALIPGELLFVHGGISSRITGPNDLRHPTREVETNVLWSDPFDGTGEHPNSRGVGVEFGKDITDNVCSLIGVKRIVRSHEPMKARDGPYYEHNGKVITTSSTNVYGGRPFALTIDPRPPYDSSPHFL